MFSDERWQIRDREQKTLLQKAVEILQDDQRVVAAWLFGSRGRHTSDLLSDTDLWVVVRDEYIEVFQTERRSYVARLGQPILFFEVPENAPAGGAYLMALYPGQVGTHQIDWYWQRQSDASLPRHAELLFARERIPQDTRQEQLDPPGAFPLLTQQERAERVTRLSTYFWVLSNIAVKHILRHQSWLAVETLEKLRGLVDSMRLFVGLSTLRRGQEEWRTTVLPPVTPGDQVAMLRETARAMESLTPSIEAIGARVQSAIIPSTYDFFDLAEAMLQQNGGCISDESK